jgi:hypothetical protein
MNGDSTLQKSKPVAFAQQVVWAELSPSIQAVIMEHAVATTAQAGMLLDHLLTVPAAMEQLGLAAEDVRAARRCLVPDLSAQVHFGCCAISSDTGGPPLARDTLPSVAHLYKDATDV